MDASSLVGEAKNKRAHAFLFSSHLMTDIKKNLQALHEKIEGYALLNHRDPTSIHLLAVSKGHSIDKIKEAFNVGQKSFGENYLQEALQKISALENINIEWHFIGPIQSNKTKNIATHFLWAHCVDSLKIAQRLNDQRPHQLPSLNICIQVNVSEDISKAGIPPQDLLVLAKFCATLPRLNLRGLMTIPVNKPSFADQRVELHKLFLLKQTLAQEGFQLDTLSMGMSADLAAAIAEGSTIVRVGTAIFGDREKK